MSAIHTTPLPPLPDTAIRSIEQAKWHMDVAIRNARSISPAFSVSHLRDAEALIANAIGCLGVSTEGGVL